ncbi:MAG: nucleoside triphosphate pyrophosphohydrolase [Rhodospirillales bacterium]|nr:nucleoside triphosphate pyrophosphohydrolase [Rhodospirillales bacterium]MCW8951244.1 nucleoside triphosphate pyrophosphohydrolase [Rhodospirillales bacterium]MCW9002019.1 nucleoside triphosphate pyrophosphohydrolase [Rhodospirillales bacterium]
MRGTEKHSITDLLSIMERLRHPTDGCPWDVKQTFKTIAPYTIEEAYEVADAIEAGDSKGICNELGDLLFQVVFHSRIAEEMGAFTFDDVVNAISEKMIRRHPHVFADAQINSADAQSIAWEDHKESERRDTGEQHSALDGVARGLPALLRAAKLQKRAARVGFDWDEAEGVLDKIIEEIDELSDELAIPDTQADPARFADELGDILFSCVNLARKLTIDPETAMRHANAKFERRFRHMETALIAQERSIDEMSMDELDSLWEEAKENT